MTLSRTNEQTRFTRTKLCESFKLDKRFLYIILIDLAYYAIFFGSIAIFLRNAIPEITVTQLAKDLVGLLSKETMALYQHDLSIIQAARNNLTWYSIILTLVLFLNFSCLKLWIWHLVAKKKYGMRPLIKGIMVNAMFFMAIFVFGFAGFYLFSVEISYYFLAVLILVAVYFLNWVHLTFAQKGSISAIYQGIFLGVKGFFQVLFPNLLIIILLCLLILIFKMLDAINPKIYWPLVLISFTIFLNWAKHLLYLFKKPFFPNR